MMIRKIEVGDGDFVFIEVNEATDSSQLLPGQPSVPGGLPEGSREVAAGGANRSAAALFEAQLRGLARMTLDALCDLKPTEVTVEAYMGFAGDVSIIPFIASSKTDGGLKIKLMWRREG